MEVDPGVGIGGIRLGQTLAAIEAAAGPSLVANRRHASWDTCPAPVDAYFDDDARCELIEVYAPDDPGCWVTLEGVQLTGRLMDDVVDELEASGLTGLRTCLTVDYPEGFTLFSLDVPSPTPGGTPGPGTRVEGVAVSRWPATTSGAPGAPQSTNYIGGARGR